MKLNDSGIPAALAAAVLFGAGTPLAKLLLEHAGPWLLAALLYLGSGLGLWLLRQVRQSPTTQLARGDWLWLAGAVATGGVAGPVLLMTGLTAMPASSAALLLNAEGVFTALLAWFVFKENFDRRIALGMIAIVAGAVVLSWPAEGTVEFASLWPALAVLGACLAWAIDNNLTRKVALSDASWIAMVKGLAAGATNLVVAVSLGAAWPGAAPVLGAALVGFFSYGTSLTLFVVALRHLGTARTGAYFSVAPFFGALMALALLHEPYMDAPGLPNAQFMTARRKRLHPYIRTLDAAFWPLSLMGFAGWRLDRLHALWVHRLARAWPTTVLPVLPSLHDRLSNRWFESPVRCRCCFLQPV